MTNNDEVPSGFAPYRPEDAPYGAKHLLVPTWVNDEIRTEREARRKEAAATQPERKAESAWSQPSQAPAKNRVGDVDVEEEQQELDAHIDEEEIVPGECAVYERDEPLKMLRRVKESTPDRDRISQLQSVYISLKGRGRFRRTKTCEQWRTNLSRLDETHPHFANVTQIVRERLALSEQTGRPARIPPVLLLGMAGVGKTHYSTSLAAALGTSHRQIQLDTAVTDSALMGNDKRWGNTAYGALFEEIALGEHANPVFVLDELDKALRDTRSDPLAPLHSLLEPVTSTHTRDISLDFVFDASHVIWIATANHPQLVPQPLRTRMKEFWIHFPTAEQSIRIAREVARAVVEEMAPTGFEPPSEGVGIALGHLTAREARQATADAVARAVAAGRQHLEYRDFPPDVLLEEHSASAWLH